MTSRLVHSSEISQASPAQHQNLTGFDKCQSSKVTNLYCVPADPGNGGHREARQEKFDAFFAPSLLFSIRSVDRNLSRHA